MAGPHISNDKFPSPHQFQVLCWQLLCRSSRRFLSVQLNSHFFLSPAVWCLRAPRCCPPGFIQSFSNAIHLVSCCSPGGRYVCRHSLQCSTYFGDLGTFLRLCVFLSVRFSGNDFEAVFFSGGGGVLQVVMATLEYSLKTVWTHSEDSETSDFTKMVWIITRNIAGWVELVCCAAILLDIPTSLPRRFLQGGLLNNNDMNCPLPPPSFLLFQKSTIWWRTLWLKTAEGV